MNMRLRIMQDLKRSRYAEGTQQEYLRLIDRMMKHHWCCPSTMDREQVRAWADHLHSQCEQGKFGPQRLRQHYAALRFLFAKSLGKPDHVSFLGRGPSEREKLPVVLSVDEVDRLLAALKVTKYRVCFTLVYATGLRIAEACRVETGHIDAARGVLRVLGKGNKERLVPLSPRLLRILRAYWKQERPQAPWMFTGRKGCLRGDTARVALKACRSPRGADEESDASCPAALLRHPSARQRDRPASDPGAAWSRQHQVHDALRPGIGEDAGQDQEPVRTASRPSPRERLSRCLHRRRNQSDGRASTLATSSATTAPP